MNVVSFEFWKETRLIRDVEKEPQQNTHQNTYIKLWTTDCNDLQIQKTFVHRLSLEIYLQNSYERIIELMKWKRTIHVVKLSYYIENGEMKTEKS